MGHSLWKTTPRMIRFSNLLSRTLRQEQLANSCSLGAVQTGRVHAFPTSPCPSVRHKHAMDHRSNPHIPNVWNTSIIGPAPKFINDTFYRPGDLTTWETAREDIGFRNRTASLLDLDFMLGTIISGLEERGVLNNTYVFFTSDNGYHLGSMTHFCCN